MKLTAEEFLTSQYKVITLMGMSGVGKTRLACLLRQAQWFHYSADYRIGTRYLDEYILDNIKREAMKNPLLCELLRSDSIHINNNMSVDNLQLVSSFLGKLGNPEAGGLAWMEFRHRQNLHRQAELSAMYDIPAFIQRSREVYGYHCFINDTGGSLCELEDPELFPMLAKHSLIIYIRAGKQDTETLLQRAAESPKPLYYHVAFLEHQVKKYMQQKQLEYSALIDPEDFTRWIFPELFSHRLPLYQEIADQWGCVIDSEELSGVETEQDFLTLVAAALTKSATREVQHSSKNG